MQHKIPTSRRVENVLERIRPELEVELRGRGISNKGKNKRELADLCLVDNIAMTRTAEKIKGG